MNTEKVINKILTPEQKHYAEYKKFNCDNCGMVKAEYTYDKKTKQLVSIYCPECSSGY